MQTSEKIGILKRSFIFSVLDENELTDLAELTIERNLETGEFVFWEGDEPECFYIVATGRIKVFKHSAQGKEFIINFFDSGDMFGEVAVFEDKPFPASAQAVNDTIVLGIKKDRFISFLSARPPVSLRIIGILGGRLRDAQNRLTGFASERVEQRIARALLMLSSKLGNTLPFTRQDIAETSGTTTETAIRVLSRFKDSGIIQSTKGKIIIKDKTKLSLMSEGPPTI